jgi:hypothetical protein
VGRGDADVPEVGRALEGSHLTRHGGFSAREEEEFLLHHGPKQVRKTIKEPRKAREEAQTKRAGTS